MSRVFLSKQLSCFHKLEKKSGDARAVVCARIISGEENVMSKKEPTNVYLVATGLEAAWEGGAAAEGAHPTLPLEVACCCCCCCFNFSFFVAAADEELFELLLLELPLPDEGDPLLLRWLLLGRLELDDDDVAAVVSAELSPFSLLLLLLPPPPLDFLFDLLDGLLVDDVVVVVLVVVEGEEEGATPLPLAAELLLLLF